MCLCHCRCVLGFSIVGLCNCVPALLWDVCETLCAYVIAWLCVCVHKCLCGATLHVKPQASRSIGSFTDIRGKTQTLHLEKPLGSGRDHLFPT